MTIFQTGATLFLIGLLFGIFIKPYRYAWDWRDIPTTVPLGIGALLMGASPILWLARVLP